MADVGCTTPFHPNKTQICTDIAQGAQSLKIYNRTYANPDNATCPSSCVYLTTKVIKTHDAYQPAVNVKGGGQRNISAMEVVYRENIKVTRAIYLYSGLSLIAEIGGYVGLFLGVSIIQINNIISKLF